MAVSFPSDYVPSSIEGPRPIYNGQLFTSPLTQTSQRIGSSTQLHEVVYTYPPMSTDQMRICRAITDKFERDEAISPVYELHKIDAATLGMANLVTHLGELVTHLGEPVWYSGVYTGDVKVGSGASSFSLPVTGAPTELGWKAGQPISINTGGRWYLYTLAADSDAGSTSKTLTLTSAIRAAHASGDAVAINRAYIQGHGQADWSSSVNGLNNLTLTIREVK